MTLDFGRHVEVYFHSSNYWGYQYGTQLVGSCYRRPLVPDYYHISFYDKEMMFSKFIKYLSSHLVYIFLKKLYLCLPYCTELSKEHIFVMCTCCVVAAFTSKVTFIQTNISVYANLTSCPRHKWSVTLDHRPWVVCKDSQSSQSECWSSTIFTIKIQILKLHKQVRYFMKSSLVKPVQTVLQIEKSYESKCYHLR